MADVMNEIYTDDKTKILSGNPLNFYTPRSQRIRSCKVYFSPKQEGSGTPSPDNVRPITGWTGVEVNHCGKNFLNKETADIVDSGIAFGGTTSSGSPDGSLILKKGEYTLSASTTMRLISVNDSNKQIIKVQTNTDHITFEIEEEQAVRVLFMCQNSVDSSSCNYQLELGSESTDYTPYKTKLSSEDRPQYIVDWSSIGTIYGGYVDLVSGELVSTYDKVVFTPTFINNISKNAWNGNGVYKQSREIDYSSRVVPFVNSTANTTYCNMAQSIGATYFMKQSGTISIMGADALPSFTYILLYENSFGDSIDDYKTALTELYNNGTPLEIVSQLKTDYFQRYQLSPATLSTLMFDNNFWSNADRIEIEYDYIGVFDALESRKSIMSGTPHLETAKDSIISFGTDMAANLKECKVYFKPKQDLHGYSKPWIGGTGKNLFDKNSVEKWYYIAQDGSIVEHTADIPCWTISNYIPVTPNSKITYTGLTNVGTSPYSAWYDENKNLISTFKQEIGTNTLTVPSTAAFIRFSVRGATPNDLDDFMVANGESISEYEPYENICPIEGWNSITITICGKNLYNYENIGYYSNVNGKYVNNSDYSYWRIKVKEGDVIRTAGGGYGVGCYFKDGKWVKKASGNTYTVPSGVDELTNNFTHSNMYENIVTRNNPDMSYEPYQGVTLTIEFPQTIYGGYVDLIKGEVVEEYAGVVGWTQYKQNNGFIAYRTDISNYKNNNCMCNMIGEYGSFNTSNMTKNIIQDAKVGVYKYLALDETININDLVVVLPLATQNTYPLTPQTITALRGTNTIWTNSNDETEVKYYAHSEDAYQHIPTSDAITSNDDFLLVTDDGYVIGTEDDFITY